MANGDDGGNRSILSLGVRTLNDILVAIQALAPTSIGVTTVAGLPAAATAGIGARRLVTDANSTTFHAVAAGGGANVVPCYSDGSVWRLG